MCVGRGGGGGEGTSRTVVYKVERTRCRQDRRYTPYEGLNLANQEGRKLGVCDRKL